MSEPEREGWRVREEDQAIYNALNELSPHYRETLTEYYGLYGRPVKRAGDIAEERGMNKKAVEHVIRRAKDKMIEHLGSFTTRYTVD